MAISVVGAGLGRTGTSSLKIALEQLGVGRCYHMEEVLQHPEHVAKWLAAADGQPDWDDLLGNYGATLDYPACTFWQQLADYYPSAKILLSVRDPVRWFQSTQETIMSPALRKRIAKSPIGELNRRTVWSALDHRMDDRDYMVDYFERRTQSIIDSVASSRLLVFEVKQGWAPLCSFLGLPVPDSPFPHVNSREETKRWLKLMGASAGGNRAGKQ